MAKIKKFKNKNQEEIVNGFQVFMNMPIPLILSSIETTIKLLAARGVEIRDWDDKSKTLKQVRMIGGKVYFFAEKREEK
nr:MAG: hypothetical protein [Bacteriophage sp.]